MAAAPDPGDIPGFSDAQENLKHDDDFEVFEANAESLVPLEDKSEQTFDTAHASARSLDTHSLEASLRSIEKGANSSEPALIQEETANDDERPIRYVSPKDFELLKVIGMGAFGKVLQVRTKETKKILAMKIISKRLLRRKQGYIENVVAERDILTKIRHPFIVNMHCSFQTKEKLFIIMDFLAGGELFLRLGREGIFLEKTAAFYLGEIILALDHLHARGILHRDLKPENILLSSDGHICVTDFGLARDLSAETGFGNFQTEEDESRALTVCGTQEYMSPEMLSRTGYGRAADYWSLGCISFEMLSGRPPFESRKGAKVLFSKIMTEKVKMPDGSTAAACKLLKGLLNRDTTKRWGAARSTMFEVGGVAGLKSADFFKHLDWEKLESKDVEPPDSQPVDNDEDLRHFYDEFKQMPLPRSVTEMSMEAFVPRRIKSDAFRGFSFVHDDFVLPERRNSEMDTYWNQLDEDGESESETASSKMGEEEELPKEPEKKKRPPRKRKKKNKVGDLTPIHSAHVTPAPSEAGDKTPTPSINGDNDEEVLERVVESKPKVPAQTTPAVPTQAPQPSAPTSRTSVPSTPPAQKQVWAPVSSGKKTQQKNQSKQNAARTLQDNRQRAFQMQNIRRNPNTTQSAPPQPRSQPPQPQIGQSLVAPPPTYRPAPGSWAARAQNQASASRQQPSTHQPPRPQRPQLPTRGSISKLTAGLPPPSPSSGRSTWSGASLQPPPSPSGDWRSKPLAFNSPVTPGRAIRKVAQVEDQQQFWPTLDPNAFPATGNHKAAAKPKPQGAWGRPKA